MKVLKQIVLVIIFSMILTNVNAQLNRALQRGIQSGVERAAEKKAEEAVEKAVSQAIDKALEDAEAERARSRAEAEAALKELEEATAESDAQAAPPAAASVIPEVGSTPYSPVESEYVFFAMKPGDVQVFVSKDDKGKISSQSRSTIKSITGDKNAFAIAYQSEIIDEKGNPADKDNPMIVNYRVVVKDGIMYLDMKEIFGTLDGLEGVEVIGTPIKIPGNLSVGQTLDDATARVRIGFINCTSVLTEGKCVAIEDVTVEAGTFRCYKVSQKVNSRVLGIKSEGSILTWYATGAGAVKTESYDSKGKLLSSEELKSQKL